MIKLQFDVSLLILQNEDLWPCVFSYCLACHIWPPTCFFVSGKIGMFEDPLAAVLMDYARWNRPEARFELLDQLSIITHPVTERSSRRGNHKSKCGQKTNKGNVARLDFKFTVVESLHIEVVSVEKWFTSCDYTIWVTKWIVKSSTLFIKCSVKCL